MKTNSSNLKVNSFFSKLEMQYEMKNFVYKERMSVGEHNFYLQLPFSTLLFIRIYFLYSNCKIFLLDTNSGNILFSCFCFIMYIHHV